MFFCGELVKEIDIHNIDVGTIIMDDDCTTMSRIRKELSHNVEKWTDQNHTVKPLGNSLYALQKKHKQNVYNDYKACSEIIRAFQLCNMTDKLGTYTLGIVDTLPLFKTSHPDLEKHSQEHLVSMFVKKSYFIMFTI